FFKHTAPPSLYTLSLHDALPIFPDLNCVPATAPRRARINESMKTETASVAVRTPPPKSGTAWKLTLILIPLVTAALLFWLRQLQDRKSTRLNSSHRTISYAVFCL